MIKLKIEQSKGKKDRKTAESCIWWSHLETKTLTLQNIYDFNTHIVRI